VVAGTGQLAFRGVMWESNVPDGCGPRWEEGILGCMWVRKDTDKMVWQGGRH